MTEATTLEQEDSQNMRIRNLEIRVEALEKRILVTDEALEKIINLVRTSEVSFTRKMMQALSGVFHGLSDQLAMAGTIPTADQYGATRVADGTEHTVIVKRTGDKYSFYNSDQPDVEINQGVDVLIELFTNKQLLADGDTGWFSLYLDKQVPQDGIPATSPGESEVSA